MNIEEFKKLVNNGKIRDKWYFYKRTELEKQKQTEELPYLINFFKEKFNVVLYPIYGTLLGIIRDNDYILYDNDIDLSYLSNYSDKKSIKLEYDNICKTLQSHGLLAKKCDCIGQLHAYDKNKLYKFDIWTSFITNNKLSIVPLINKALDKNDILPFKTIEFRKINLSIPNNEKTY